MPAFEDPDVRLPGGLLLTSSDDDNGSNDDEGKKHENGGKGEGEGEGRRWSASALRMPSLIERLRVITIQLLQYDAPLESKAEICEGQRRLVHALEKFMEQHDQAAEAAAAAAEAAKEKTG